MARTMRAGDDLFRATITETFPPNPDGWNDKVREGFTQTYSYGPYTSRGPATAAKRREEQAGIGRRERYGDGYSMDARVERIMPVWERVG
ncbi:hypothetical protein GCM10010168_53430 [Actinoplanes ianthinogenes]|uniref:Uncharacterized protein n=1 Tax=Actinoplanes ianthinogenes TaxID=122358 RepID=A0ABM7LQU0_9ACTN|nr:hypothetical protein [Actinoplanes ianthinogenes]BCJ41659.1 hypothetical protein Aiant_23160 [Actinoplanes ianthinogenes]GGR28604.1 hypothetical protein GCM10010168_53430 [Actinoplanes ianthinogenes]